MPLSSQFPVFQNGKQMLDGDVQNALMAELYSVQDTITAKAGGTQAAAVALTSAVNRVSVCATGGDSVKLPAAVPGREVMITNSGAASLQVFGSGTDTINGVATATGVAQGIGLTALYKCISVSAAGVGAWFRLLSA